MISNYIAQNIMVCNYLSLPETCFWHQSPHILWDVITYPCLRYPLLVPSPMYLCMRSQWNIAYISPQLRCRCISKISSWYILNFTLIKVYACILINPKLLLYSCTCDQNEILHIYHRSSLDISKITSRSNHVNLSKFIVVKSTSEWHEIVAIRLYPDIKAFKL